ncbi:cache domain-containing protein [Spirulina subsalsa]|uniref:cache domain-containing protein n=1 Tax=Spirulina subsalsa TaxID=54311 RepID=UPI000A026FAF|nr:cache domain-containing protein [Spirulina subsalsa]
MKYISLRTSIPLLTIAPLVLAIGLTGGLAFHNTRQTIDQLSSELSQEIADQVAQKTETFLAVPRQINQLNYDAFQNEQINLDNLPLLERYFWHKIQVFDTVSYIYLGTETGEFRGAEQVNGVFQIGVVGVSTNSLFLTYSATSTGDRNQLVHEGDRYDPRIRPWYTATVTAQRPIWSEVYTDFNSRQLAITATHPVKNTQDQLVGVFGVDVFLNRLDEFLKSLKIAETGQVFIIERDGFLIGSSGSDPTAIIEGEEIQRVSVMESQNPILQATANYLVTSFGDLSLVQTQDHQSFKFQGNQYFVRAQSFRDPGGLDWLIVVVIPEADFLAQVNAQTQMTVLFGLAALILAAGVGFVLSNWLVRPVMRLNDAALSITTHRFDDQSLEDLVERSDEVGEFARAFRDMAVVVGDRTQSLSEQLEELQDNNPLSSEPSLGSEEKITELQDSYKTLRERAQNLRQQAQNCQDSTETP